MYLFDAPIIELYKYIHSYIFLFLYFGLKYFLSHNAATIIPFIFIPSEHLL